MQVLQWIFFVLCLLAFTVRAYIRLICFRQLLFEDWLMVAALACHLAVAILGQLYLIGIHVCLDCSGTRYSAPGPVWNIQTAVTGLPASDADICPSPVTATSLSALNVDVDRVAVHCARHILQYEIRNGNPGRWFSFYTTVGLCDYNAIVCASRHLDVAISDVRDRAARSRNCFLPSRPVS